MNDKNTLFQEKAKEGRILALEAIKAAGNGHIGGIMSVMDALAVLYFDVMRVDPANPRDPDRDRFVMSKGHAGPALYSILALRGFFDRSLLHTLNHNGTKMPSHCDMNKVPGVDMTAGSLGQGISAAEGMALAGKLAGKDYRVYCVVGDGECQEGEVWEAALLGRQQKLDNFIVLLDNNGGQVDGYTRDIADVSPLDKKWEAFGWSVQSVDGHDHGQISAALAKAQAKEGKPHAIVLNTVKAKGIADLEGTPGCHHTPINDETFARYMQSLK